MVFLGSLGSALPSPVVVFVDVLIGLHLLALLIYAAYLSKELMGGSKQRARPIARED